MTKRKHQQLGKKSRYSLYLGNKRTNQYLDNIEHKAEIFYIEKLREAYEHTTIVQNVNYTKEEQTALRLLKGEVNGLTLKHEQVVGENILYIFQDADADYIIVLNRYTSQRNKGSEKITKDIQNIYREVESVLKSTPESPTLKLSKTKETIIASFGMSSALAEKIADKYNLHHIAFNPVLFNSNARIYKIRGDAMSLYAHSADTYEIVKTYSGLDNNASDIKNF
jgi:hypothetical protein